MEQSEFLQILNETTDNIVTLIRASIKRMGESTAEQLRKKTFLVGSEDGEIQESEGYKLRTYSIDEKVQINTVITNVIRLVLLDKEEVREFCKQCVMALLDILGGEVMVQKYECPKVTIDLYNKLINEDKVENVQIIDKLSQIVSILYNNINIQS